MEFYISNWLDILKYIALLSLYGCSGYHSSKVTKVMVRESRYLPTQFPDEKRNYYDQNDQYDAHDDDNNEQFG
jgi:hypothetical protein